jgi:ribose/xylose/arabinose/galactoside ABC-type transport system permease subunit
LGTILDILNQTVVLGIMSLAFLFVYTVGGFDISIGATCSFAGVVAALSFQKGASGVTGILLALVVGLLIGVINAFLCGSLKIQPMLATLSVMFIVQGIEIMLTKSAGIYPKMPEVYKFLGQGRILSIPFSIIMLALVAISADFILRFTRFGRYMYAVGSSRETAEASAINAGRIISSAYVISGILASFSGIMLSSRLGSAQTMAGDGYLLNAIAAVFLGTTMFGRGEANVPGTIVGAFFMMTINTGLTMANVWWYWQYVVTGLLLVLAVLATSLRRRLTTKL